MGTQRAMESWFGRNSSKMGRMPCASNYKRQVCQHYGKLYEPHQNCDWRGVPTGPLQQQIFKTGTISYGGIFSTPYYKVNGHNGPREFGVTVGFALPVSNNINNRSVVNIAFQWGRSVPSVSSLITENYLRLNVGITFNERWFMKWKIQ